MTSSLKFKAVKAKQSDKHQVVCFAAKASEIHEFASIEQIFRDGSGELKGFQRPQIESHINEIRDYLKGEDAVLPNPIVVAFTKSVSVQDHDGRNVTLEVDISDGPPGLVVDGQQRLTALSGLPEKDFEVFVSALVCRDEEELRRQFILINNTRPLPKSLIYELLPSVDGLPDRMSSRSTAAKLTDALNYQEGSSLKGQIKQHTNPDGVIGDTAIQKLIMNSLADGACREFMREPDGEEKCFNFVSDYFEAVQRVFPDAWEERTPKTSRLVHGAGIVSMGFVMEYVHARDGALSADEFEIGIKPLMEYTAWTSGNWQFGENEIKPWNGIQNLHRDIQMLASYLTRALKRESRARIVSINDQQSSA